MRWLNEPKYSACTDTAAMNQHVSNFGANSEATSNEFSPKLPAPNVFHLTKPSVVLASNPVAQGSARILLGVAP